MALKEIVKVNRKTFFNPSAWLGYDFLKAQTLFIYGLFKQVFAKPTPEHEETFEQAVKRLHLSEKAIHETQQSYFLYAMGFLILSVLTIIFGFYLLLVHATLAGWILSLPVAALLLSQAFRYHFWYFQMKHRKLGCTFKEWKQGTFGKKGPKS
jgi:intracellular multiplication protein IcmV